MSVFYPYFKPITASKRLTQTEFYVVSRIKLLTPPA